MRSLFSFVKNKLVAMAKRRDHPGAIRFHFYYGLHNLLLKYYKGDYTASVHGAEMTMPAEHLLPVYVAMNPLQEKPVIDVAESVRERDGFLNLIDIGANIGDTILMIAHRVKPNAVLAIEGSDKFYPYLEKNVKRLDASTKIHLEKTYLSDVSNEIKVSRTEDYGTGSLKEDPSGQLQSFISLDDLLTSKYPGVAWNFIKLDTDGFDYMIMKGARKYLTASKTSLFFEFDPVIHIARNEPPLEIFSFLASCGFTTVAFYNNWGELILTTDPGNTTTISELIKYTTTYHRFHYDILATKK